MQVSNNQTLFNYFNTLCNNKIHQSEKLKKIFYPSVNPEVVTVSSDGMEILKNLPTDLQRIVLEYAQEPDHFFRMRLLCDQKVVNLQAVKLLKEIDLYSYADRIKMRLAGSSPQKYLWEYVFSEIRSKCNAQELETIVQLAAKERHALRGVANRTRSIFEKFLKGLSGVLNNLVVQIGIGFFVGYYVYNFSKAAISYLQINVLPIVVNKIINVAPLFILQFGNQIADIATALYRWRITILITCFVAQAVSGTNTRIGYTSRAISFLVNLPKEIALIPINLAIRAYNTTMESSRETSIFMQRGADNSEVSRLKRGLDHAQNSWVQQMIT